MTPTETATQIIQRAEELGVTLGPKNGVLTVQKSFEPGDSKAYVRAESDCNAILRLIKRTRPGSTWGASAASPAFRAGTAD